MSTNNHDDNSKTTAPLNGSGESANTRGEDASDFSDDEKSKLVTIMRAILKWENAAAQCVGRNELFDNEFKLLTEIGAGSFGRVYRAQVIKRANPDHQSHEVALKLILTPVSNLQLSGFDTVGTETLKACFYTVVNAI